MIESLPPSAFSDLRSEWQALFERSRDKSLFATHAWLVRWLESFGEGHRIFVERDGEGLTAAVILRIDGALGHHLEDHTYWPDILARHDAAGARRRLLDHLRGDLATVVLLGRDDEATARAIETEVEGLYEVLPKWTFPMHGVATAAPFEEYLASRRGKVRSELKRKDRRFFQEVEGAELVELGPEDKARAMEAIRAIEAASWKDEAATAIISNEPELHFYDTIAGLDEEGARARTYLLMGGGEPRAFVLGVAFSGSFHALKTSYRAEDAKLSPGQVLFYRIIERLSAEPGITRLELLGRDSRWKQELATDTITMRTYWLERRSIRAVAARMAEQHLKPRLREAIEENPRLGEAVSRAREGLRAARRLLGEADDNAKRK